MNALRDLRRVTFLSQREFAALIDVPWNTFRMWDSGLRPTPSHLIQRANLAVADHARNTALLSLDQLAREFRVHERTLRAAARTGRLAVTFSSRSAFGRPMRLASRTAVQAFMGKDYRRFGGQSPAISRLPSVPRDYDVHLKRLRRRVRFTQHDLARRIGTANKAVVYQWESRQRTPSPVFWQRVEALRSTKLGVRGRDHACQSAPIGDWLVEHEVRAAQSGVTGDSVANVSPMTAPPGRRVPNPLHAAR